jgi:HK97 family phage prohead protease
MPWHIVADDAACPVNRPFGVHKDDDDELEGCHQSEDEAEAQLDALYASEEDDERAAQAKTFEPPKAVQDEAQKALGWIADGFAGDGFTAVGRRRASQLANGEPVSLDTLKRMQSYFARHEPDTEAEGFNSGETGYPTPGRVAWSAWGGNPGRTWSKETLTMNENRAAEIRSIDEIAYPVTIRQRAHYEALESVVELCGKFDVGTGGEGAHYVAASPFASEGLVCANCVFYEGARGCELVDNGTEGIDPGGVCKLWIIPEALLVADDEPVPMNEEAAQPVAARSLHRTDNLLRALTDPGAAQFSTTTNGNTLFGHFAVFNEWTRIESAYEGTFMERIAPGAFSATFAERGDSIRVLYDHGKDPSVGNKPLGVPMLLTEDERGAFYQVELFDTAYVNELRPALEAGQLGASFRFSVIDETWTTPSIASAHNPERLEERTITKLALYEFGPVTFPAYEAATAGLRSRTDDFMRMLTDPAFAVRLADRIGTRAAEHLIGSLPLNERGDQSKNSGSLSEQPAGNKNDNETTGRLVASALTELARRAGQ